MKKVTVLTDFSASSDNAIRYVINLMSGTEYSLSLLHVFTTNIGLAADGVALASMKDAFSAAEDEMADQIADMLEELPGTEITTRIAYGTTIEEAIEDSVFIEKPDLLVMGGINDYSDIWAVGPDLLNLFIHIATPALVVPKYVSYSGVKNIGYACDFRNLCTGAQISFIKWLVSHTSAQLHIIHVTKGVIGNDNTSLENEAVLREAINETHPLYHTIQSPNVIESIANFIADHKLDLMIVVPHKHDFWNSILHQSHSKELAKLNNIPTLMLHD